jgi:hypothetical protein
MKKWLFILMGNVVSLSVMAQNAPTESVEMADALRSSGKIYVVVLVITVILTGLILYLIQLDRKVRKMETEFSSRFKK